MAASPASLSDISQLARLTQTAQAAAQLAAQLEAGQAQMPLTDGLRRAADPAHAPLVRILLCGLSPEAVARTLSHLLGHDFNFCKVVVPSRVGYTEVQLQERGFVLEADTARQEFDTLATFVQALEERDLVQAGNPDSWMDPRRLGLSAPADAHGLCLLVPDSLSTLVKRPALLSLLADQADWVVVAGDRGDPLMPESRALLQTLAEATGGLRCVVLPGTRSSDAKEEAPSATRWWEGWRGESIALPLLLAAGTDGATSIPPLGGPLRDWLRAVRRTREVESGLSLLAEQVRQQTQSLQNRRRLQDEGLVTRPGVDAELRKAGEAVRSGVQHDMDEVSRMIDEQFRQALLPESPLASALARLVETIGPEDLDESATGSVVNLRLTAAAETRLRDGLLRETQATVLTHLETLHDAVDTSSRGAAEGLGRRLGRPAAISCDGLDAAKLWESVARLARPEIRYKGEIPRTTFIGRIMAARQIAFGVVMIGMVLSGVATLIGGAQGSSQLRTGLYVLVLPLFLGGFLYTFWSFRKKEEQAMAKEVEKLREGVTQELRRVAAELMREASNLLKAYLTRVVRDLGDSINHRLREHEETELRRVEQTRTQTQELAKNLEVRLRQLTAQETEVRKLLQSVAEVRGRLNESRKAVLGS